MKTVPAPVGGWNARDPLPAMNKMDAVVLENFFPRIADVVVRGGSSNHVTGFTQPPKTLANWAGLGGSGKMFAAASNGIFDASVAGAVGAAVLPRTQGYHSWVQMGVSGGNYLIMVNGVDNPAYYDGITWTAVNAVSVPALTGVTSSRLVSCNVYKRRLFFLEISKLSFWYLAADAIGGALTEFNIGPLCTKGGFTMAMGTWTLDGGSGPDDYAVFVTSEGEAVVFTGTNPSDPAAWALVGVYFVGKPLGRRCFKKYGGDLVLITEYGAFPLSKAVQSAAIDLRMALSNKIEGAYTEAARLYGSNSGWVGEIVPHQAAFVFNVPTSDGGASAQQFVMNTTTKSWCKFTGWNASDFCMFGKELYFSDQTSVKKAWTTHADSGVNIVANGQAAYTNFGDTKNKDPKLFRPTLTVDGSMAFSVGMSVDFDPQPQLSPATYTVISGAIWDAAVWDADFWGAGLEVVNDWRTPGGKPGQWLSGILTLATNQLEIHWTTCDYVYETGPGAIVT